MTRSPVISLKDLLTAPDPDFNQVVNTFICEYNTAHGIFDTDHWDITKEDWQRYEFLGDSVLNLVIAHYLFEKTDVILDEGEMTKILSRVVSNRSLDALTRQYETSIVTRLIPRSTGEQKTYGERITGGSFEAFLGALYCEAGLDDVAVFVRAIMKNALDTCNPDQNSIGILQEYVQKNFKNLPEYTETIRTGPDHKPLFTYEVFFDSRTCGEGSGDSKLLAKQAAAKRALEKIGKTL
jgi:ribonuclease-3